jgi:hypothetical protein
MFTPLFLVCCSSQTDVITINYPPINGLKIAAEVKRFPTYSGQDSAVLIIDDERITVNNFDGEWQHTVNMTQAETVGRSELPPVIDWGGPSDAVGAHPFSLMDFNFDGKYELLIELYGGGNRHANQYIVIGHGDGGFVQWDDAPFNELHAGGEIDLEKKEIQTWGSGGVCWWERVYWHWYPEVEQWLVHKKESADYINNSCRVEKWKVQYTFYPNDN